MAIFLTGIHLCNRIVHNAVSVVEREEEEVLSFAIVSDVGVDWIGMHPPPILL